MKCPRCWAEKAYKRQVKGWKGIVLGCALLVPMKCHHCYHKFVVFRPLTFGKQLRQPALRISRDPAPIAGSTVVRRRTEPSRAAPDQHR